MAIPAKHTLKSQSPTIQRFAQLPIASWSSPVADSAVTLGPIIIFLSPEVTLHPDWYPPKKLRLPEVITYPAHWPNTTLLAAILEPRLTLPLIALVPRAILLPPVWPMHLAE